MTEYWPLADLRISTPDLELRLPSETDLHSLAELAARGVHADGFMPFGVPWSALPAAERARGVLQWHWRTLGAITKDSWDLPFVVLRDGVVVGTQSLKGSDFRVARQVSTGSWLGLGFQRQGIGTQMRAAVLELAFRGLGATRAETHAFIDNPPSLGVSRKLGYQENGRDVQVVESQRREGQRLLLTKDQWNCPFAITWKNLGPCLPLLGADH